MIYATFEDVVDAYELTMPAEHQPRVETLLRYASARLSALVPSLEARVNSGEIDPDLPAGMVVEAVLRVYRNPAGVTQQSAGPYTRSLNREAAKNDLWFDPDQIQALLATDPDSVTVGVGTFRMGIACPQAADRALDTDPWGHYTPEQYRGL